MNRVKTLSRMYSIHFERDYMKLIQFTKGLRIDNYQIIRLLGQGGMGKVYLVKDEQQAYFALKIISRIQHEKLIKRFLREIEVYTKLNHPNIIKTHAYGTYKAFPYFVMDYIPGFSLGRYLEDTELTLSEKLLLIRKIANALEYSHQQNIIHRDIKPSNILIHHQTKEPIIMDFGLAKDTSDIKNNLTGTGEILGTPSYLSPEQARGEKKLDKRSDIYSLGTILYKIMTGKTPFTGKTLLHVVYQTIHKLPLLPRRLKKDIPKEIEAIILKSLLKDKKKRYQSMSDFTHDIERYLDGKSPYVFKEYRKIKLCWTLSVYSKHIILSLLFLGLVLSLLFIYKTKSWRKRETIQNTKKEIKYPKKEPSPKKYKSSTTKLIEAYGDAGKFFSKKGNIRKRSKTLTK